MTWGRTGPCAYRCSFFFQNNGHKEIDTTNKAMNLAATKKTPRRRKDLNGAKQTMNIVICALSIVLAAGSAFAAENGMGFYLLGQRGQGAGVLPPEGVFFSLPSHYYSGDTSDSQELPFNGKNNDTDYRTGTEFHLEASVFYQFTPVFPAGLNGYHYQQITDDSGQGAELGSLKGRVCPGHSRSAPSLFP